MSEPDTVVLATEHEARSNGVSRRVLVLSVLAALVVAGVAGMAIGWKVEQARVKDDLANIRPVGTVTAIEDGSVTIDLITASGTRTFALTDDTAIDTAQTGEVSDVVEGSTVLVKNRRDGDGNLQATEIIVLPETTTFGR